MSSYTERMTNDQYRNIHFLLSIDINVYSIPQILLIVRFPLNSHLFYHSISFSFLLLLFLLILAILICPFHLHTSFLALPLHCFSSIDSYRNPSVLPFRTSLPSSSNLFSNPEPILGLFILPTLSSSQSSLLSLIHSIPRSSLGIISCLPFLRITLFIE